MSFVHLHVHTEYSTDGMSNIKSLFKKAAKLEMPGLTITDHGTLAGVPEFLKTAEDFPTVKPIVGCECWLGDPSRTKTYHLILLAKNLIGYKNLVKLSNIANTEGLYPNDSRPHIGAASLAEHCEGLICTSACIGGEIPQLILAGDMVAAKEAAAWYKSIFGDDFYLEVALHRNFGPVKLSEADNRQAYMKSVHELNRLQKKADAGIFEIAQELGIKVIATNDVHFVNREDGVAHDVMRAIQHGKSMSNPKRIRYSHLEYMKTEEEMRRLFPEHPEVIDNTIEVLDKVERYSIWGDLEVPQMCGNPEEKLREAVFAGAEERFGEVTDEIWERLDYELNLLCKKGCANYILMIKDLVDWVRSNNWVVGPGRNVSASSMVNYCLGITGVDPVKHELVFERFYNWDKDGVPSIDLDVEPAAQEKVLGYLKEKYGQDCVAEITSFEYLYHGKARREALKKLGNGEEALEVTSKLETVISGSHIHPCGILVSTKPLTDIIPLSYGVSEYEAKFTDKIGILRLNVLQLRELRILQDIMYSIEREYGILIEPEYLPLDDKDTLELFARGDTVGVFQFGSEMMREHLRNLKPDHFDDLVVLETMTRPGIYHMIPHYIARKHGDESFVCEHDELWETLGLMIYQEQEMKISKHYGCDTFPKAHALCYTLIAYQMAWYKANYPHEFYEALLNGYMDKAWELDAILQDAAAHHVHLIPPDKTESGLFEVVR